MIEQRTAAPGDIAISECDTLRYLGYGTAPADDSTHRLLLSCREELLTVLTPRACFARVPIVRQGETLSLGFGAVTSRSLSRHLANCDTALVFAATLGTGVDRLLLRYAETVPSRSVMLDALATAAIESWCDLLQTELSLPHRPRFSAGYGDFDLAFQRPLLDFLDTSRRIGIALTEALLMTPTKSVSAIVGIERTTP